MNIFRSFSIKTKNAVSDVAVVFLLYLLYTRLAYFQNYFSNEHRLFFSLKTTDIFFWIAAFLIIFLVPFRLLGKGRKKPKSMLFWSVVFHNFSRLFSGKKIVIKEKERVAILSLTVSAFYFPLMINWCLSHFEALAGYFGQLVLNSNLFNLDFPAFFDNYFFWFCFNLIFFIDTIIFSTGYLSESRRIGNVVRSVEPTIFGWAVALACYPPFNQITGYFIPWRTEDFISEFGNFKINFFLNILILLSFSFYVWASIALGFKAGNLVNRGIVKAGPYRFIRHPAYISKNFAWWVGSLPFIAVAWKSSGLTGAFFVVICVLSWSLIYYFRAITEERHLLRDPDYREYARQVRWRFLPGIF